MTKRLFLLMAAMVLLLGAGCKPRVKEITSQQRREAASLVSEAQFALTIHDGARAETLFAKATAICPDTGDYWIELGRCRVRLGNRGLAKDAYQSALTAYENDAAQNPAARAPGLLRQIYVLALLGRAEEARARLAKAQKELPDNRELRAFADRKQLEQMLASPTFREVAL